MKREEALLIGPQAVREALRADRPIDKVWISVSSEKSQRLRQLLDELAGVEVPCLRTHPKQLERLAGPNHQGIVARVSAVSFSSLSETIIRTFEKAEAPLLLVAEGCTDVRNLGAMARSVEALGAHALVLGQEKTAALGEVALRTSAGALLHLPVCRIRSLLVGIEEIRTHGLRIVAATPDAKQSCTEVDLSLPVALVVGEEGSGLRSSVLRSTDEQVRIPMQGKIESLNVSTAAAILLYEAQRQRASTT